MTDVIQKPHGRHMLKAMKLKGDKEFTARAFNDGGPAGIVAETRGATAEAALTELAELLDTDAAGEVAARRTDASTGYDVPTEAEYVQAVGRVAPKPAQMAMLRAHAASGEQGMTASELASAAGYANGSSAALHYGKLAFAIAEDLGMERFVEAHRKKQREATGMIGAAGDERKDQQVWIMHPELIAALNAIA